MRGIAAGRRWVPLLALSVLAVAGLAVAGVARVGWQGLYGLAVAGVVAQLTVIAALRPAVACCAVRRAGMGTLGQVTAGLAVGLALAG